MGQRRRRLAGRETSEEALVLASVAQVAFNRTDLSVSVVDVSEPWDLFAQPQVVTQRTGCPGVSGRVRQRCRTPRIHRRA